MIYVIVAFLLIAVWLFIELVTAPTGYENKSGFHYGHEPTSTTEKGNGEQISINPARN